MRCKTCDYPLWHITSRTCPECGSSFKPSDYEFTLNSVRFCCPLCQQAYYGTGPKGELVPRAFACVGCGKNIDMDEMVLLPAEGVQEERTEGHRQPWLERGTRRGFWSAWFGTIGHAMVMPGRLMKATPPESPAGKATAFAAITLIVVSLAAGIPFLLLMLFSFGMGGAMSGGGGRGGGPGIMFAFAPALMFIVGTLMVWGIGLVLTAGAAHGILLITGGCSYGFKRTWQAMCYSSGANAATAVPCIGGYFGWIWWLVSACIALKEAQRVHGGRATLAVLTVPITAMVLFIGGYALLIYSMVGMASAARSSATVAASVSMEQTRVSTIVNDLRTSPRPVGHVAQLMSGGRINLWTFMDISDTTGGGYTTRLSSIPLGRTDLNSYMVANPREQRKQEQLAADLMDPNTIAYRLGDTVLTHRGIDPNAIPAGSDGMQLWLVIGWPESLDDPSAMPARPIVVGLADGGTRTIQSDVFDAQLALQNTLRVKYGLEPLPSPETITHAADAKGNKPPKMTVPTPDSDSTNPTPPTSP